jgi:hypothetical protein
MNRTKYEKEFFSITEKLCFEIDENGSYSFDSFNYQLFNNVEEFKSEIIENITVLPNSDREFYLNRIINRLNHIIEKVETIDEKTGKTYQLGIRAAIIGNSPLRDFIIEPEEIQLYFSMISRYKQEMLDFINNLQPQLTKTKQQMDFYFELQMKRNSALMFLADFLIEFDNKDNVLPSEEQLSSFIFKKKIEITEILNRLTKSEKILYLDKLQNDMPVNYTGLRKRFIEHVEPELIFDLFPRFRNEKEFHLSNEELELLENKYSFYASYRKVMKEISLFAIKNFQSADEAKVTKIPTKPDIKPIFSPEFINVIFELLKDFFSKEHQTKLKEILQNGSIADTRLTFLDNGNRLADAFKQLIKSDIIKGCEQKELEAWIQKNFCYRYRNKIKEYTPRYLNDIISTNKEKCQNPILNVRQDKATGKQSIIKA